LRSNIVDITRPKFSQTPIELQHGNETWKIAGKTDWSTDVTTTFHDVLPAALLEGGAGDVDPAFSVSIMYDWKNIIQNITTGAGGLSSNYKCIVRVDTLAPDATLVERFIYYGMFPTEDDRGGHKYEGNEALTVSVTWSVDKMYRVGLTDTTAPAEDTTVPSFSAIENER
jgi:hypothetical protein